VSLATSYIRIKFFYIHYTTNLLKNKKALQQKAKGLGMSGSPSKTIFELFA